MMRQLRITISTSDNRGFKIKRSSFQTSQKIQ